MAQHSGQLRGSGASMIQQQDVNPASTSEFLAALVNCKPSLMGTYLVNTDITEKQDRLADFEGGACLVSSFKLTNRTLTLPPKQGPEQGQNWGEASAGSESVLM